jgi:hypothetical protein
MKWWSTTRFVFFVDFFDAGTKRQRNLGARDSRGIFRGQEGGHICRSGFEEASAGAAELVIHDRKTHIKGLRREVRRELPAW